MLAFGTWTKLETRIPPTFSTIPTEATMSMFCSEVAEGGGSTGSSSAVLPVDESDSAAEHRTVFREPSPLLPWVSPPAHAADISCQPESPTARPQHDEHSQTVLQQTEEEEGKRLEAFARRDLTRHVGRALYFFTGKWRVGRDLHWYLVYTPC